MNVLWFQFLNVIIFNHMYAYVSVCGYVHMSAVSTEAVRGHQMPWVLDPQVVMRCSTWFLGT